METGIQTIQSSPCAPCLLVNRRAAAPGFDPYPDMLWSRFPFGISAGSSPAPVSRSGMSYANKLSSFEHSFLLRATTAHAHSGDDQLTVADARRKLLSEKRQDVSKPAKRHQPSVGPATLPIAGDAEWGGGIGKRPADPRGWRIGQSNVAQRGSGRRASPRSLRRNPWAGSGPYTINPQGVRALRYGFFPRAEKSDRGPSPSCRAPVERG